MEQTKIRISIPNRFHMYSELWDVMLFVIAHHLMPVVNKLLLFFVKPLSFSRFLKSNHTGRTHTAAKA